MDDLFFEERNAIVATHLSLVAAIAHTILRRLPRSFELDDLTQVGTIGCMTAAEKFDAGRGTTFDDYAYGFIRGAILRHVAESYREETHIELCDVAGPWDIATSIDDALAGLPGREREVVELRYRSGLGFAETAKALGFSQTTAIKIHNRAIRNLRATLAAAA